MASKGRVGVGSAAVPFRIPLQDHSQAKANMATMIERGTLRHATIVTDRGRTLERVGESVTRYGLVLALLWIGALKFTAYEAEAVHGLASHSPLLAWAAALASVQGFSILIGCVEILLAILIASRSFAPMASAIGSLGAAATFVITLSFLFSTPGVVQTDHMLPALSGMPGQFLLKDVVLLGAALWTAGEAMRGAQRRSE